MLSVPVAVGLFSLLALPLQVERVARRSTIATTTVAATAIVTASAAEAVAEAERQAVPADGVAARRAQLLPGIVAIAGFTAVKAVNEVRKQQRAHGPRMMSEEEEDVSAVPTAEVGNQVGSPPDYVCLFADLTELVGVMQKELGWSDGQARARLAFLSSLDAADEPLAAFPGNLALSGHLQSCVRYLFASDDECAAGCFKQDFMPSVGHFSVVPVLAVATGDASREAVVVGGCSGRGLSLGRIAELDAAACGFCARIAEAMLAQVELPSTTDEHERRLEVATDASAPAERGVDCGGEADDEDASALKQRLSVKQLLVLSAFARDCRIQSRCSLR